MFIPIKSTDGAMTPFEYIEAAAGTYQVGQLLNVTDGKLAAIAADQATTPPYVCMQSGTVAAGELLRPERGGALVHEVPVTVEAETCDGRGKVLPARLGGECGMGLEGGVKLGELPQSV